jgi:hypothetical protein
MVVITWNEWGRKRLRYYMVWHVSWTEENHHNPRSSRRSKLGIFEVNGKCNRLSQIAVFTRNWRQFVPFKWRRLSTRLSGVTTGKAVTSHSPPPQTGVISPRIISLYGYDFLDKIQKRKRIFSFSDCWKSSPPPLSSLRNMRVTKNGRVTGPCY